MAAGLSMYHFESPVSFKYFITALFGNCSANQVKRVAYGENQRSAAAWEAKSFKLFYLIQ